MKKYAVLLLLSVIITSLGCDYGLDSGSDLIGKWSLLYSNETHEIEFMTKNTGYEYYYSDNSGTISGTYYRSENERYFTYKVSPTDTYNWVKRELDDSYADINTAFYEDDPDFEYYFSLDKTYLYIRFKGESFFSTYQKN